MCPNRAIVENLECCLDDLVECFEDFIRKSLIVIFIGLGIIVGLLCYLLKIVSERPPLNSPRIVPEIKTYSQNKVSEEICCNKVELAVNEKNNCEENKDMNTDKKYLDIDIDKETCATLKTLEIPTSACFDESVLSEVSFTECSKNACDCGSNTHVFTASRVPVPSLPTSASKHKLTPGLRKRPLNKSNLPSLQVGSKTKQGSCCSMCCSDEPKGGSV